MAELTGGVPSDVVTCRCGRTLDRNVYSQCPDCSANLWDPDQLLAEHAAEPDTEPADGPRGTATVLEPDVRAGLELLACGRRLTVVSGRTLQLGREDDCETVDAFRACSNVSRAHAVLRFDGTRLFVTDTASSNGTFVNEQRLPANHEYELRPGQTLRLASNVPIDILWER